jgi:hypothetical protein
VSLDGIVIEESADNSYDESIETSNWMDIMPKTIAPGWNEVKKALNACDRAGFLKTLHDLYQLNKGNQSFFHARFLQDANALEKYKKRIYKNLSPDFNKPISVSEAKRAIAEYRKAVGRPEL